MLSRGGVCRSSSPASCSRPPTSDRRGADRRAFRPGVRFGEARAGMLLCVSAPQLSDRSDAAPRSSDGRAPGPAVQMSDVAVEFGSTTALNGFDLEMQSGEVLGLLGPNGSGKTTAVKVLATLLRHDEGTARVFGLDVVDDAEEVRRRIALAGQYAAVDEILTGRQNLSMFGELFGMHRSVASDRATDLLDAGDRPVKNYSGGMRRRLDLASALLTDPPLLFLDEPTTGLDLRSRNTIWDVIGELAADGATVLLTTPYLAEADALADRIAVMDHGRVIATGTPAELKQQTGGLGIRLALVPSGDDAADERRIREAAGDAGLDDVQAGRSPGSWTIALDEAPLEALARLAHILSDGGVDVRSLELRGPDLDDVFLRLTGDEADDVDGADDVDQTGAGRNGQGRDR